MAAGYHPSTPSSRAACLATILGAHAVGILTLLSVHTIAVVMVQAPMQVALLPPPLDTRPAIAARPLPLPRLHQPPVVVPEAPRIDLVREMETVQRAPSPAVAPAPRALSVAAPVAAEPAREPPRFDLAYLDNPAPAYPYASRRAREEGRVLLRVQVSATGRVDAIDVHASSGHALLDEAALAAVRRWRFVPAREGEHAVAGVALVPISFQMS